MLTKADFQRAIRDSISSYPAIAPLYQAGDPRILQHLDAMATMLAMVSAQVEVAQAEPFEKTRDATVLADAAMRGIVRKGTPARVRLKVANSGTAAFALASGRVVMDSAGYPYQVEVGATAPPGGSSMVEAVQLRSMTLQHTVARCEPFYPIEIPPAEDGGFLCAVAVRDAGGDFVYRERYVNTAAGERVFHIEADDQQRVYARFGLEGVVGVQLAVGAVVDVTVSYTAGDVVPAYGSPFSFEYLRSPADAVVELTMESLLIAGQNPMPMSVLRDLARYPSVYDHNAVYLGEFDFLVRRQYPALQFLSIWNEAAEERARGPSVDHINQLFVACLSTTGAEQVLTQAQPNLPVAPLPIAEAALTPTQQAIRRLILRADDSYEVVFRTPVRSAIPLTILARVATSYDAYDVRQKIIEAILKEFGEQATDSKRGRNRPLYQRTYALLRASVPALSAGDADLQVSIDDSRELQMRPEMWRFVSPGSLSVTVETGNVTVPFWSGEG